MQTVQRQLEKAGYQCWAPSYHSFRASIPQIVEQLAPSLANFRYNLHGPLHFVTHSLGGLVARAMLTSQRPDRLGRVVMLAPPNGGSEWADLLFRLRMNGVVLGPVGNHLRTDRHAADEAMLGSIDFDLGVIAGNAAIDPIFPRLALPRPNDGKVSVRSTHVEGLADHITLPVSHTFMVTNPGVARQVLHFLRMGRFDHR